MRILLSIFLFASLHLFAATDAHAGSGRFGLEDKFKEIQDLNVPPRMANQKLAGKWPLSEVKLFGHYKIRWVLLGAYLERQGYVLKTREASEYLPLDDKMIADFQAHSLLPDRLPDYSIDTAEYLFAYSLWIFLLGALLWYGGKQLLFGNRSARQ